MAIALVALACIALVVYALSRGDSGEAAGTSAADALATTPYASGSPVQYVSSLADVPPAKRERVEVVYFHRTQRCHSCMTAERLTRRTVETYFSQQIAEGSLSLSVIDVQSREASQVVGEYGAYAPSLFIGVFAGGVHYVYHASDTYVALRNDAAFLSILRADIEQALGHG